MNLKFVGIVREVKDWTTDRDGNQLPADKVTSQITFLDRPTGGDVVITFPAGHGYKVDQDVNIDIVVKPQIKNYKLQLYAQPVTKNAPK
jgi:gluconate kinase